nr:UvrD-helicase domain-containing protein [Peptostreptococcus faecalis]
MKKFTDITSNLDALKLKKIEFDIYKDLDEKGFVLPKVIPFKGINTDMLYIKDDSILFLKYMDTTEELFSFLDEEIIEIMKEEHDALCEEMNKSFPEINFNYIFVMPYINQISEYYEMKDFIENNIVCGENARNLFKDKNIVFKYLKEKNDEIKLTMFLLKACSEYFTTTKSVNLNEKIRKISFHDKKISYKLVMKDRGQIVDIASVNYGNHLVTGGSGTGKSALLVGRVVKLSKIYPHHKFLILTFTKQQANKIKEKIDLLNVDSKNIEIHSFSSFIFKVAKANKLVIDYNFLKKDYDKSFLNIMKQIDNAVKNKKMFKGIFIDEGENFSQNEIKLIHEFLYNTKNIFNISICKPYNINNDLKAINEEDNILDYEDELILEKNYRQSSEVTNFINNYCENCNSYLYEMRKEIGPNYFMKTKPIWSANREVNFIDVEDLDEQINSVIWEAQYLINDLGYNLEDIAIVYPYNKKRLKSGKVIYFQYMLRKSLESAGIDYIYADEDLTNITPKQGLTISNIYSIKSLSYKAVIICELEMMYNQKVIDEKQDYQVNDFIGDLNKVYTAMTRAEEYLSIITSYSEEHSDIIRMIKSSKEGL